MASIQFSCVSTAKARTSRKQAAAFGKIRTTSVLQHAAQNHVMSELSSIAKK